MADIKCNNDEIISLAESIGFKLVEYEKEFKRYVFESDTLILKITMMGNYVAMSLSVGNSNIISSCPMARKNIPDISNNIIRIVGNMLNYRIIREDTFNELKDIMRNLLNKIS